MSRKPIRQKDIEAPDRILAQMLQDYIEGRLGAGTTFYQASIIEIDPIGGVLAGPGTSRPNEPKNPRNSLVARVSTDALDLYTDNEDLTVFWPLFSHDVLPIKEGEMINVIFQDPDTKAHGMWISRISEPYETNNPNFTPGVKKYLESDDKLTKASAEKKVQDSFENQGTAVINKEFQVEVDSVKEFNNRVGDRVIAGSNNTLIVMSRDRVSTPDTGVLKAAGTIDVVAGMKEKDPSQADDLSRVLVTMSSDVDANFALTNIGESEGEVAAVALKSDEVRIIARNGMKLVVESGTSSIVIDKQGNITIKNSGNLEISTDQNTVVKAKNIDLIADTVNLGEEDAKHPLVYGDELKSFLESTLKDILSLAVVDVAGVPALGVINPAVGAALSAKFATWDTLQTEKYTVK